MKKQLPDWGGAAAGGGDLPAECNDDTAAMGKLAACDKMPRRRRTRSERGLRSAGLLLIRRTTRARHPGDPSRGMLQASPTTIDSIPVAIPRRRRASAERTRCWSAVPATPDASAMPAIEPSPNSVM